MEFIPDNQERDIEIPYFEDADGSDGVVGYSTTKSQKELRALISTEFARLGGTVTSFQSGKYGNRYAFRISFTFHGHPGRMDVAALPINKETDARIDKAKKHALYSVWKRLQSEYNTSLVMPGDAPFVPYMLNEKGQTMIEYLRDLGQVPSLPEASESTIIDGEFDEI